MESGTGHLLAFTRAPNNGIAKALHVVHNPEGYPKRAQMGPYRVLYEPLSGLLSGPLNGPFSRPLRDLTESLMVLMWVFKWALK